MTNFRSALVACVVVLAGCAGLSPGPAPVAVGIDGVACVGSAPDAVANLKPGDNATLQAKAQLATGKGGVCAASVFAVVEPVQVYRVYDGSKPWSAMGGWWSLSRPVGPRDAYRALNAICKEWSSLDQLVVCQVKPGSDIVLGTTQSVDCPDGTVYPKTADIQVYMANDSRAGALLVENCREEGAWP